MVQDTLALRAYSAIRTLWDTLNSHDFTAEANASAELAGEFDQIRSKFVSAALFWCYAVSSFTYSFIGAAMLVYFNERLPRAYHDAVPLPLDVYAACSSCRVPSRLRQTCGRARSVATLITSGTFSIVRSRPA